jgi:hypothetical protein
MTRSRVFETRAWALAAFVAVLGVEGDVGAQTPTVDAAATQPSDAAARTGAHRNFVGCPIVRDTKTVPCWLAEHDGELYYVGIQTDISADFDPPYLGHRVLVEGVVKDGGRICGGIVLEPVNVSPLPELDGACNTILPAEDRYQVPFAPRPPGPSAGRLAFAPPPGSAPAKPALAGPQEFTIEYDFDTPIMGRHSGVLTQIYDYAIAAHARRIVVHGYRGATLLSDGTVITERDTMPEARAKEVAKLLIGAGLPRKAIEVGWSVDVARPRGDGDWRARRTVVRVEP